ncbi:MAG TPA: 3-dehydroquinate synthase II [Methanomassiliicoccales archaeon]|nr:3-dehydroquinate synthase II [Methanomassiliicoccales archaeon]
MTSECRTSLTWVRADHLPTYDERKKMVSTALESGYVEIIVREEDAELRRLGRYDALVRKGSALYLGSKKVAEWIEVSSAADLDRASAMKDKAEAVVIVAKDWKIIPLENLIADMHNSRTKVIGLASTPEEARVFLATLEKGVDGLVLQASSPSQLKDFHVAVQRPLPKIELSPAKVSRIAPVAVGDRVCLDTCSLLRVGEGVLVGSQSACLFLIGSESMESEYVASRPFRVNAGAVHAYVLAPDGKTRYLSEMRAGDEVLAVDSEGNSRAVVLGRSKIERRPLLLIEVEAFKRRFTIIVQNAETIRLCSPQGPVSVSDLKLGQEVLVRLEEGGRHFGRAIKETITEV